jgi:diguanylate cyclase (GGDEF)-like protein/PAS domain S-box-containing protein
MSDDAHRRRQVRRLATEILAGRRRGVDSLFAAVGSRPPLLLWDPTPEQLHYPSLVELERLWRSRRAWPEAIVAELGPLAERAMVVDPLPDRCDFIYHHYGRLIARHYGDDLTGRRTLDVPGHVPIFAAAVYRAVTIRKRPILTEHEPPRDVLVRHWRRVILPLTDARGAVYRMLVGSMPEDPIRDIVDAVVDGVVVLDERRVVRIVNPAAARMTGVEAHRLQGRHLQDLVIWPASRAATEPADHVGRVVEAKLRRADASALPVEVSVGTTAHHGQRLTVLVVRDIAARKAAEHAMRELVYRDDLTGIANRRRFEERLEEALAQAERSGGHVAVLLLDLDGFKAINDRLGHSGGDAVLRALAERLRPIVRRSDLLARLGGDEFALLLVSLNDPRGAEIFAARVLERLTTPLQLPDRPVPVAASIGIAIWPDDATTADELVRRADEALYAAKRAGGARYLRSVPVEQLASA